MFRVILFLSIFGYALAKMPANYSDYYARHKLWPMAMIFGQSDPQKFMDNECFNSSKWYGFTVLPCDDVGHNNNITCSGGLAVSDDDQAIIMVFRGTINNAELTDENVFYNLTVPFPGGGTVAKFWYNGFLIMWNGGLRDNFFSAKNANPTYELWITGMSMGGSLSGNAAAYISQMKYMDPNDIKMVSFGQTRVGFDDFSSRYPSLVPYAYRVTHNHDIVPHVIPRDPPYTYTHYKNEIWYPNNMTAQDTSNYVECDDIESTNCANSVPKNEWTWSDHWYFGKDGYCKKGSPQ